MNLFFGGGEYFFKSFHFGSAGVRGLDKKLLVKRKLIYLWKPHFVLKKNQRQASQGLERLSTVLFCDCVI